MFNKWQQFEFPGSACPSCGYWPITLCNEMKLNETRAEASVPGSVAPAGAGGRRALTHDAEQLSYQVCVTDITQCSSKKIEF